MKMNKIVQKFQKAENVFFLTMKSGEEMCTFFAKNFFLDARRTGVSFTYAAGLVFSAGIWYNSNRI